MTMLETLRTMHNVIRGTTPAALGAAALHVSEARLSAYRRFIKGHIISTLYKNYTTMADILEGRIWVELASAYYHDVPADHWELNRCVRHFPEWLSRQLQAGKWPLDAFYVDLAVFEQREFAVYASTQEIETPPLSPCLNPTLEVLQLDFPVATFVAAYRSWQHRGGSKPNSPRAPKGETVFMFRHPKTLRHSFEVATSELLLAFKVVHDQLHMDQAARLSGIAPGAIQTAIQRAARAGLVLLPSQDFLCNTH